MGIQNSPMLEVGIGLVFLYLIFGLLCTAINELVSQAFRLRAETLWGAVRSLLQDPTGTQAARDLYNHQLIRALAVRNGGRADSGGDDPNLRSKPSYLPASLFSLALVDRIANPAQESGVSPHLTTAGLLANLPKSGLPADVQGALAPLIRSADGSLDQARKNIEDWYDAGMERATGWYKQRIQKITLFVAFLAVFLANADTLMLVDRLWANPVERTQLVEAARAWRPPGETGTNPPPSGSAAPADSAQNLRALSQFPPSLEGLVGWSGPFNPHSRQYVVTDPHRFPRGFSEWLYKLLGLLLTAFAASLGAPFWFDVLNKIINIRSSGQSPNEAPRRPSKKPDPKTRIGTPQPTEADSNATAPAEAASRTGEPASDRAAGPTGTPPIVDAEAAAAPAAAPPTPPAPSTPPEISRATARMPVSPMSPLRMGLAAAAATAVTGAAVFGPHRDMPLNLDTINGCSLLGRAVNAAQTHMNPLKNRYSFPAPGDMDETVTLASMLHSTRGQLNETKAAEIEGYITRVKQGGIESCNCGTTDPAFMDTHVYVNETPQLDEKRAVIVEVTPRLRQEMQGTADWSTASLSKLLPPGTKVRISGWLFYDAEHENASENIHPGAAHNWRGTCWEIHPVTGIEMEEAEQDSQSAPSAIEIPMPGE